MANQETKLIAEIDKSANQKIRVSLNTFKEKFYVDLRVFVVQGTGEDTTLKPTVKGITFSACIIDQMIAALKKADKQIP